jgi:hypothetical protein
MDEMDTIRPRGLVPIGIFFIFGASMAGYAAITLLHPGTPLDALWSLNKPARAALLPHAHAAGALFLILSSALAAAAVGWFRRQRWGWLLGTTIIAINAIGDATNLARGEVLKGAIGVAIAGGLLIFMLRPKVRNYFARR